MRRLRSMRERLTSQQLDERAYFVRKCKFTDDTRRAKAQFGDGKPIPPTPDPGHPHAMVVNE